MGKRSAQAHRAGGVRDQSRMAMTRYEAWGVAREPDGGTLPRIGYMMAQMGYDVATLF